MEWELNERSKKCLKCAKPFEDGEFYRSVLFLSAEAIDKAFPDGLVLSPQEKKSNELRATGYRVEICLSCWNESLSETNALSRWKGEVFRKPKEKNKKLSLDEIFSSFKDHLALAENTDLTDDERIDMNAIAYFLAVMLERKNILIHKDDTEENGIRTANYFHNKTETMYQIRYPLLTADSIVTYNNRIRSIIHPGKYEQNESETENKSEVNEKNEE